MSKGFLATVGEKLADNYFVGRINWLAKCADDAVYRLKMKQRAQKIS